METAEASVTGTLRIIALLILVWAVLRMIRNRRVRQRPPAQGRWAAEEQRSPGSVRIERADGNARNAAPQAPSVTDADFEEMK